MVDKSEIALCRQWSPFSLATFYEMVYFGRNPPMKMTEHLWPVVLGLCDERIRKLMLIIGPGSGKSALLSVAYPAWVLGHDPNMTILDISSGESLAQGFQIAVMDIVERSSAWKQVFPDIKPDKASGWSNERGMFVTGRRPGNPDASFLAAGLGSKFLTGKHAKRIIMDDIHDADNSATSDLCRKVRSRYYSQILGRQDPAGAKYILAGRRWHEDDIYGHLMKSEDWVVMHLPAERAGSHRLFYDIHVPDDLTCVFTDRRCFCADGSIVDV